MKTPDWDFKGITPKPWDGLKDPDHSVIGRIYKRGENYVLLDRSDNDIIESADWMECYNAGIKKRRKTKTYNL